MENFGLVLNKARHLYEKQVKKGTDVKLLCIESCIKYFYKKPEQFYKDYKIRVDELCDSISFCNRCKELNVDPEAVAQNMLFDSIGKCRYREARNKAIDKYIKCNRIFN